MTTSTQTSTNAGLYIDHNPTYHTDEKAQYVLPNDSPEHVRLETQAKHLSNIMNGQIIHAPVSPSAVQRVLDVGCGTGAVTEYLARNYPQARVYGLDISPVPVIHERLPNVTFMQGNILTQPPSQWKSATGDTLPDECSFDLTYSRLLLAGISDWPLYLKTCFKLLRPGGWTEIHDLDWTWYKLAEYSETGKEEVLPSKGGWLYDKLQKVLNSKGIDFECGFKTASWMREAGYQDIQVRVYHWPFGGDWQTDTTYKAFGDYIAREMPGLFHLAIDRSMKGVATEQEIEEMKADMWKENWAEPGKVWKYYVTCGRKPA